MPDPIRFPQLLTEPAAAEVLGVSVDTLRRARKAGKISHTIIDGRVRYTDAHLISYIKAGERPACTASANNHSARDRRLLAVHTAQQLGLLPYLVRSADPTERRASLGTDDLEQAKLRLAAWVMANGRMEGQPAAAVCLETYLARYYEQHAKNLANAEPTRYGPKKWCYFFVVALVSEVTSERQRQFVA
jgi:hypothetical protein